MLQTTGEKPVSRAFTSHYSYTLGMFSGPGRNDVSEPIAQTIEARPIGIDLAKEVGVVGFEIHRDL